MSAIVVDIAMSPPQADIGMLASQGNVGNLCVCRMSDFIGKGCSMVFGSIAAICLMFHLFGRFYAAVCCNKQGA